MRPSRAAQAAAMAAVASVEPSSAISISQSVRDWATTDVMVASSVAAAFQAGVMTETAGETGGVMEERNPGISRPAGEPVQAPETAAFSAYGIHMESVWNPYGCFCGFAWLRDCGDCGDCTAFPATLSAAPPRARGCAVGAGRDFRASRVEAAQVPPQRNGVLAAPVKILSGRANPVLRGGAAVRSAQAPTEPDHRRAECAGTKRPATFDV